MLIFHTKLYHRKFWSVHRYSKLQKLQALFNHACFSCVNARKAYHGCTWIAFIIPNIMPAQILYSRGIIVSRQNQCRSFFRFFLIKLIFIYYSYGITTLFFCHLNFKVTISNSLRGTLDFYKASVSEGFCTR